MNPLEKYMLYSSLPGIIFPWTYNDLIELPLFMIHHIYFKLDEDIEREKKKIAARRV